MTEDREAETHRPMTETAPTTVSIVVPTHNRADLLAGALSSLELIEPVQSCSLEVVVVANACRDNTPEVVAARAETSPVRCVTEERPGLNIARNRGVEETRGEIVAFVDDDIYFDPGWLRGLVEAFSATSVSVLAGRVEICWETCAPPWTTSRVRRLLSALDHGDEMCQLTAASMVVGANMAVRRRDLEALGGFYPGLDRKGRDLLSGGDSEFVMRALAAGLPVVYAPGMAVRHRIPEERARLEYLARLSQARGRTRVALARRRGDLSRPRVFRTGVAQIVRGSLGALAARSRGETGARVDGMLLRWCGIGTLRALFTEG